MRRRWTAWAAMATGVLLVAGSGAFACDGVALLHLSSSRGPAGARITVVGTGFSAGSGVPVVLRWNGTIGEELARALPDAEGEITATFTVPPGGPGSYVVVAVQKDATGLDSRGTPARASYI